MSNHVESLSGNSPGCIFPKFINRRHKKLDRKFVFKYWACKRAVDLFVWISFAHWPNQSLLLFVVYNFDFWHYVQILVTLLWKKINVICCSLNKWKLKKTEWVSKLQPSSYRFAHKYHHRIVLHVISFSHDGWKHKMMVRLIEFPMIWLVSRLWPGFP